MKTLENWNDDSSDKFDESTPEKKLPATGRFGIAANANTHANASRNSFDINKLAPTSSSSSSGDKYSRDIGQSGSTSQNINRRSAGSNGNFGMSTSVGAVTLKVGISLRILF